MFLKKFSLVPLMVVLISAIGVRTEIVAPQSISPISIYFSPENDHILRETLEDKLGIVKIYEKEHLHEFIDGNPNPFVIYIHETKFNEIEPIMLQSLYDQGNVIVALAAPISYLDNIIVLSQDMPEHKLTDLNQTTQIDSFEKQPIVASAYFALGVGDKDSEGYYMFTDFFDGIETIHTVATQMFLVSSENNEKDNEIHPFASSGVWADSTGGQLYGTSWTSKSGSIFYGNVYSHYLSDTPFFQVAQITTFNNCGSWHPISSAYKKDTYTSSPTQITGITMGSTQCGTLFVTQGTHESQRIPSSSTYVSGATSASCTGSSNC